MPTKAMALGIILLCGGCVSQQEQRSQPVPRENVSVRREDLIRAAGGSPDREAMLRAAGGEPNREEMLKAAGGNTPWVIGPATP